LKVFKENPDKYLFLEPLGVATRIRYNLRDFAEDITVEYINIPQESFNEHKISDSNLEETIDKSNVYLGDLKMIKDEYSNLRLDQKILRYPDTKKKKETLWQDYTNSLPKGIKNWFLSETHKGQDLLGQHQKNLSETEFNLLTRITLPVVYERPARRFFGKTLELLEKS